jgi:hypothetical protein
VSDRKQTELQDAENAESLTSRLGPGSGTHTAPPGAVAGAVAGAPPAFGPQLCRLLIVEKRPLRGTTRGYRIEQGLWYKTPESSCYLISIKHNGYDVT